MTKEDKELLIQDLCARLPYEPIVRCYFVDGGGEEVLDTNDIADLLYNDEDSEFPMYKPYLRPISSMTEEERAEMGKEIQKDRINPDGEIKSSGVDNLLLCTIKQSTNLQNWLNSHYFDYRGLIDKGLAIEAPKDMYNII